MRALAKMAEIPPKFGEYSYEVAKGSLWEWRCWPNGIFGEYGEHSPKSSKILDEMAKGQFESGDFNEKGEFGENGKNGALTQKIWRMFLWHGKGSPLRVEILAKMANIANIRQF